MANGGHPKPQPGPKPEGPKPASDEKAPTIKSTAPR